MSPQFSEESLRTGERIAVLDQRPLQAGDERAADNRSVRSDLMQSSEMRFGPDAETDGNRSFAEIVQISNQRLQMPVTLHRCCSRAAILGYEVDIGGCVLRRFCDNVDA